MKKASVFAHGLGILFFALLGFFVMGYHPGYEDDGIYLAAVQQNVQPALYPHDANFFQSQLQASVFAIWVGDTVRWTGFSVATIELLWQLGSILLTIYACWSIARALFASACEQWAGVAMVAAMFTLPVAGTALNLFDQHLHPRNVATALILLAVARILHHHRWQAMPLLAVALVMHPIMAGFGLCFCAFLFLAQKDAVYARATRLRITGAAAIFPIQWIFEPPNPFWKHALDTRTYYYLYKWQWYEWLGAIAPLIFFFLFWRWAAKNGRQALTRFTFAVFVFGVFQQALAMVLLSTPGLVRLTPLQPMRYLQLVYFFFCLVAGALIGRTLLKKSPWRWAAYLLIFNIGMFAAQYAQFDGNAHLELSPTASDNPWVEAFIWIRSHTPPDAYFALDPHYLEAKGENYHSFRALAERSQLADAVKDAAVVTQIPSLGPVWYAQVQAQKGWKNFALVDFERLKTRFGVDWVLVADPAPAGLACRWQNGKLSVCEIP